MIEVFDLLGYWSQNVCKKLSTDAVQHPRISEDLDYTGAKA
jgi:hypothetical protein